MSSGEQEPADDESEGDGLDAFHAMSDAEKAREMGVTPAEDRGHESGGGRETSGRQRLSDLQQELREAEIQDAIEDGEEHSPGYDDSDYVDKEVVDPETVDWRRVWDDHPAVDNYKPIGPTKLALMLDCHREITTGMEPSQAVEVALDSGALEHRGHRIVPGGARQ